MAISSLGIGSGLDVAGLVNQLVAAEGQAPLARLDRQEILMQARLSAIGSLKGALSTFQSKLATASNLNSYRSSVASVGDSSLISATSSIGAPVGNHTVEVLQLAQSHRMASSGFAGLDSVVSTGTLTIDFGSDNAGVFTSNPDKLAQTLTIDASNNTLAGVRDAINAAGMGVTASVVFNGTDHQMVLSSNDPGAENSIKITGIAELTYDPENLPANTMATTMVAQDAQAMIDGIMVTSSNDTLQDALEGVTINLKKADPGNVTSLKVTDDTGKAMGAVKAFVDGYNELMNTVKSISGYDPETETGGPLLGDPAVRSIVSKIQNIISTPVEGLQGKYRFIGDIGLATQKDGTLKLDESKLSDALRDNAIDVGRIFSEGASMSDSLLSFTSSTSETQRGEYGVVVNSVTQAQTATAGTYNGNWAVFLDPNAFSAVIGNNENNFTIQVDGVASNLITLTNNTYLSGASLAAEIQTQINADASLVAAGLGVSVAYEGDAVAGTGRFVFTSNSTGATSDISFLAAGEDAQVANELGFSSTIVANTPGLDEMAFTIDATIGGYAATQEGNYLIGAVGTPVEGLKIEYLGGGVGNRGTVAFTRGMASEMNNYLSSILADKGILPTRTEIYNDGIKDIGDQRASLTRRLASMEQRYYTQFSALDALIAKMTSTSEYLTQQLAGLPKPRSVN